MRRWAIAFALVSAVIAACSSFQGSVASAPPDAGRDDAAPLDAASDDAGEAPDGRFCSQNPGTDCLDFDGPGNPFLPWTVDFSGAPSITPTIEEGDAGDFVSTPGAMAVSIQGQGNVHPASRLTMNLPDGIQSTRLTFSVKLDPVNFDPSNGNAQFSLAELVCSPKPDPSADNYDGALVNVMRGGDAGYLVGVAAPGQLPFGAGPKTISANVWTKLEIDVAWGQPDGTRIASLYVDDVFANEIAVANCGAIATDGGATGVFVINVGLGSVTGQTADALYDNVVYEANTP